MLARTTLARSGARSSVFHVIGRSAFPRRARVRAAQSVLGAGAPHPTPVVEHSRRAAPAGSKSSAKQRREKFADDAGKKGGEFYTPRMVVKLIVELLASKEGTRVPP